MEGAPSADSADRCRVPRAGDAPPPATLRRKLGHFATACHLGRMTALVHTLFPPETAPARIKGEVRFVAAHERSQSHGSLGLLLTVCVPPPPWPDGGGQPRGRLRDAIESAIEAALEMNDAPPAGVFD